MTHTRNQSSPVGGIYSIGLGSGASGADVGETFPHEARASERIERMDMRIIPQKLAQMDCGVKKRSSGVARHSGAFF